MKRMLPLRVAARPGEYPRLDLRLHSRSVGEIFQFLGDVVHYQEEIRSYLERSPGLAFKLNTPVTFGYCGDASAPGCDEVFLRLDGESCNARFSVTYREREYHVANFNRDGGNCGPRPSTGKDHTLEILSVLHQLIGLHRSAADIRQTPTVQVLP